MREDRRAQMLRRFFSGLTEYAFHARLGVTDPPLVDYVAELLVRFVHNDQIYPVRTVRGQRLMQVADMLEEANQRRGPAKWQVHRHIGDYTLFWTGVYPEVVDRMRRSGTKDSLLDYHDQGKRNYYIASTIPVEQEETPRDVLQRLSEQFELCVYGLGEVRRQWEERDNDSPAGLIV